MQKIQKYNEINIDKIICNDAEKKEFKDQEGKQVSYYSIPIFYNKGEVNEDCLIRLPECTFFPMNEKSTDAVIVYNKKEPNYEVLKDFFDKVKRKCAEFLCANKNKINKPALKTVEKAYDALKDLIYITLTSDGKPKGAGMTYLRLLSPSPYRNSTLFVGPDKKVYPKKRLLGYTIVGSPIIKLENIYCGQSYSIRLKLIELNIRTMNKLNSASIDPDYTVDDPDAVNNFLKELGEEEKPADLDKVKNYLNSSEESDDEEITI